MKSATDVYKQNLWVKISQQGTRYEAATLSVVTVFSFLNFPSSVLLFIAQARVPVPR